MNFKISRDEQHPDQVALFADDKFLASWQYAGATMLLPQWIVLRMLEHAFDHGADDFRKEAAKLFSVKKEQVAAAVAEKSTTVQEDPAEVDLDDFEFDTSPGRRAGFRVLRVTHKATGLTREEAYGPLPDLSNRYEAARDACIARLQDLLSSGEAEEQKAQAYPYADTDLRIDTYRTGCTSAWVSGNQAAVRITHLPTGAFVESSEERSVHKNKQRCLEMLPAAVAAKLGETEPGASKPRNTWPSEEALNSLRALSEKIKDINRNMSIAMEPCTLRGHLPISGASTDTYCEVCETKLSQDADLPEGITRLSADEPYPFDDTDEKPEYGAPYQGAREDLLEWKRRALLAENRLRTADKKVEMLKARVIQVEAALRPQGVQDKPLAETLMPKPRADGGFIGQRFNRVE